MPSVDELPLQEVLQALSSTPKSNAQLRAALATTCARWQLLQGDEEGAIAHLGHALEMVSDLRPAMRLLYRIYQGRGDVRSAVMYLDQEIRATRHPREAAALYRERGQLVEAHFHDLTAAAQCYQAALKATPDDLAVLRAVERVNLARGEVFGLVTNLEAQLEVVRDPSLSAGILHDLALIEARHKGDLPLAGDLLLAALDLAPGHLLLSTDLFRLAEVAGDTELMLHALELEAEARPPERRAMPLARAAVTLREHRERGPALRLLQAAAVAQPHNASLWRSLEELSMATGRHDVALQACVGQLRAIDDQEEDPTTRAELFHRMGKLSLFRLDRATEGLAAMRKALRLNPAHVPAIEDTGRFLNANGMWAQLLELIKLEISSAADAGLTREDLALAHLRAGQLMEERLGELDGARECYENAITAHASFRPARDRLERILHQQEDLPALRHYYSQELSQASTPGRRRFLLSVLGQLHARDDDPGVAIKYLVNLLKESPRHLPSLQVLARTLARAGRQRELLKVTEQEIALTESSGRKAKLLHRAGEIAQSLGDRGRARECFEQALEAVDDHQVSADKLGALLREDKDWEGLVALLRKKQLYATDRARQVGLQLQVATLLSSKLGQKEEALKELQRLLERWPRHLPALHAAEGLATALGEHRVLLSLIDQHVSAVTGPRTRALLLHRAAQLRTTLADDDGAIRDLVRALELWPQLGVARAELLRLYERLGRSRELQAFAEAGLTSERGADDRRAMALQLAELSPKPVVAIQYLGAVAEARPEDYVTQLRLARSCRQAGRPSREAGALVAAAEVFATQLPPDDPHLLALRYRGARAQEAAGNLDQADSTYAAILDLTPGHLLARRGRLRIKERKREAGLTRSATELEAAAQRSEVPAEKAAYLTIAADLHERRQDLAHAMKNIDMALLECPPYLPALHARARLLERQGDPQPGADALETLVELADRLKSTLHRSVALCRAGTLALGRGKRDEPNPQAWEMFREALAADPSNDRAFRGLRRTLAMHGTEGAPPVAEVLTARIDSLRERDVLTASSLREVARLATALDGPAHAVPLLQAGLKLSTDDPGIRVDLAQSYARLGRWSDAVAELEAALSRELSPERKAALHFFAGDGYQRAGDLAAAVPHLLAAGQGGFHPRHALSAADRIAAKVGDLAHRVQALALLVEIGDGPERVAGLRSLATLHRGPLGQPDVAVERMRELLLLRPTDLDVITELWRLLGSLKRDDEASAVLLAGVAHHRAWLRASGLRNPDAEGLHGAPVVGLMRLFQSMQEGDGVYLASAVLEIAEPDAIPEGLHCDELVTEPWPLPEGQEGRPFDGLVGDLPASSALDLLRDGVFYLGRIPGATPPPAEITQRPLPPNSAVVMVTKALSEAMGVPIPRVFVDASGEDEVRAYLAGSPCLVVGRKVNSAPFGPTARDAIGRALLRLSTGGDALHHDLGAARLSSVLLALCMGAGVEVGGTLPDHDAAYLERLQEALASSALSELVDLAITFADVIDGFDPEQLLETLHVAEDRAGAVCAADPRPRLRELAANGQLEGPRGSSVVGYLLSDDHLTLRHNLGYLTEIATPIRREGESSAP